MRTTIATVLFFGLRCFSRAPSVVERKYNMSRIPLNLSLFSSVLLPSTELHRLNCIDWSTSTNLSSSFAIINIKALVALFHLHHPLILPKWFQPDPSKISPISRSQPWSKHAYEPILTQVWKCWYQACRLAPVARMRSTAAVASNPPIRAGRNRGRGARARGGRGGRAAVAPATGARGHGRGRGGRAPAAPAAPAIAPSTVVAPVAAAPPAAATAPIAPRAASAPPSVVPASAPGAGVAPAVSAPAPAVAAFAPAATVARASSAPASAAPVKLGKWWNTQSAPPLSRLWKCWLWHFQLCVRTATSCVVGSDDEIGQSNRRTRKFWIWSASSLSIGNWIDAYKPKPRRQRLASITQMPWLGLWEVSGYVHASKILMLAGGWRC